MSVYETIRADAHALIDQAATSVANGTDVGRAAVLRWGWKLLGEFIRLAEEQFAPGADKKAAVMQLAADFYDRVIAPLDLPGPDAVLDPLLRSAWLQLCDHAIDGLVTLVQSGSLAGLLTSFGKAA
jgi:hypothetical protein